MYMFKIIQDTWKDKITVSQHICNYVFIGKSSEYIQLIKKFTFIWGWISFRALGKQCYWL